MTDLGLRVAVVDFRREVALVFFFAVDFEADERGVTFFVGDLAPLVVFRVFAAVPRSLPPAAVRDVPFALFADEDFAPVARLDVERALPDVLLEDDERAPPDVERAAPVVFLAPELRPPVDVFLVDEERPPVDVFLVAADRPPVDVFLVDDERPPVDVFLVDDERPADEALDDEARPAPEVRDDEERALPALVFFVDVLELDDAFFAPVERLEPDAFFAPALFAAPLRDDDAFLGVELDLEVELAEVDFFPEVRDEVFFVVAIGPPVFRKVLCRV